MIVGRDRAVGRERRPHRRRLGAVMAQRAEVVLDDEEREVLERWARRQKSSQALAFRCRVVLAAAEGMSIKEIAAGLRLPRFRCRASGEGGSPNAIATGSLRSR